MRDIFILLGTSILFVTMMASGAEIQNFDCTLPENESERAVCADQGLSNLDAELSNIMETSTSFRREDPIEVINLRRELSECEGNVVCIIDLYEQKIFYHSSPKSRVPSLIDGSAKDCPNNDIYENCQGTYTWANGDKYTGEWKNDKRHGFGTQVTSSGNVITGYWEEDVLNGETKIKFASGKIFIGLLEYGRYKGNATVYDKGLKYVGNFSDSNGRQKFTGNQYFLDGTRLYAEYTNLIEVLGNNKIKVGKRVVASELPDCPAALFNNCYGRYEWDTGEKYIGEWQDNMRAGLGTFTYKNGNKYTGTWKDNVPDGNGRLVATDGSVYTGLWIDGVYQDLEDTQENIEDREKAEEYLEQNLYLADGEDAPSLLLKCESREGYYLVAHSNDESKADFLYVRNGQQYSRNNFYNVLDTPLSVTELKYSYPNFRYNEIRRSDYRKWSITIGRDTGRLQIDYDKRNVLYRPDVAGSREFARYNDTYTCNTFSDFGRFLYLKQDFIADILKIETEKKNKLLNDRQKKLDSRKF